MLPTTYPPLIGGLEFIAEMVAQSLGEAGHEVTVLTRQHGPDMTERSYRLIRRPRLDVGWKICREAQIAVMPNVGLKIVPPVLLAGTPLVVWHQGEPAYDDNLRTRIKVMVMRTRAAANFGCSDFVTRLLPDNRPRATLSNPYNPAFMYEDDSVERTGDMVVLGRLVSDKGFDVVLRALAIPDGPLGDARLTVVGGGPELENLQALARDSGIADRVSFVGPQTGDALRRTLNAHKVMVVPSVWQEPFGIVALEGLACGCSMVVSAAGGLPEAIGAFGRTFKTGDPEDAARVIAEARAAPRDPDPAGRKAHLARHRSDAVAARLVELLTPYTRRS